MLLKNKYWFLIKKTRKLLSILFLSFVLGLVLVTPYFTKRASAQTVNVLDRQINLSSDDAFHDPDSWPSFSDNTLSRGVFAGNPGAGSLATWGGWRFTNLGIPTNATIVNAYVDLNQRGYGYVFPTNLAFENSKNPLTFSLTLSPYNRWSNRTAFQTPWTWGKLKSGSWIRTPSLSQGVQELVNRYGAINEIVLLEDGTGVLSPQYHEWESYDTAPTLAAKLHVEYTTAIDSTPPLRSNGQPGGNLPSGTSQTTINLTTNENAICKYDIVPNNIFGAMPNTFTTTGGLSHSQTILGLTGGSSYNYYIRCQDQAGNANIDDFIVSFNVLAPDTVPPQISSVGVVQSANSAIVNWTTDEASSSKVNYGLTEALGTQTDINTNLVTSHSVTLTNLNLNTQYFYKVLSKDASNNESSAPAIVSSFTTLSFQPKESKLGFLSAPLGSIAGEVLPQIQVAVFDQLGNINSRSNASISLKLGMNPSGATLSGTTTVNAVNGIATFQNLRIDKGGSFSLVAYSPLKLKGRWDGSTDTYADVWGDGNLAFLGHYFAGKAEVIDVSNPENPILRSTIQFPLGTQAKDGKVKDGIGYFASDNGGGVYVVDLHDPSNPVILSNITLANGGFTNVHNIFLSGNFLFLADYRTSTLKVFDVSNPANPVKVYTHSQRNNGVIHDVAVVHDKVYIFGNRNGVGSVEIYDATKLPSSLPYLGTMLVGDRVDTGWVTIDKNYAFLGRETSGGEVSIWDVSNPKNPTLVRTITPSDLGFVPGVEAHHPRIVDNIAYISWWKAGTNVFEVSDPLNPVLIGTLNTMISPPTKQLGIFDGNWGIHPFAGHDRVYASDTQHGLFVIDTTPTATRSQIFRITSPNLPVIAQQPVGANVTEGTLVTFSVSATNALSYQWQKNGANIPEATLSAYMKTAALKDDGSKIRVLISNQAGSVFSNEILLGVTRQLPQTPTFSPITAQVSQSSDDAFHTPQGWPGYDQVSVGVTAGYRGSSGPQWGGFRWANLNIPANATITNAYVELNQLGYGDIITTTLAFEDSPNPSTFSLFATPMDRWEKRTTFLKSWTWGKSTPGSWIKTPSLATGIQELVQKYGTLTSLVLLENALTVPTGKYHDWGSFDGGLPAKLHIEYTLP